MTDIPDLTASERAARKQRAAWKHQAEHDAGGDKFKQGTYYAEKVLALLRDLAASEAARVAAEVKADKSINAEILAHSRRAAVETLLQISERERKVAEARAEAAEAALTAERDYGAQYADAQAEALQRAHYPVGTLARHLPEVMMWKKVAAAIRLKEPSHD